MIRIITTNKPDQPVVGKVDSEARKIKPRIKSITNASITQVIINFPLSKFIYKL